MPCWSPNKRLTKFPNSQAIAAFDSMVCRAPLVQHDCLFNADKDHCVLLALVASANASGIQNLWYKLYRSFPVALKLGRAPSTTMIA